MDVYEYTDDIDLSKIILYAPKSTQGGGYSAKIKIGNNDLAIQTPKIKTKNGIHKTEKKVYCDLIINKEKLDFINFIKKIEEKIKEKILDKGSDWFKKKPSYKEIDKRWNSILKIYKNTNTLVRTLVEKQNNDIQIKIWDENQKELNYDNIDNTDDVICLFHISNLRFSSTSFQIDLILKQIMKFDKVKENKCLIKGLNKIYNDISNDISKKNLEGNLNNNSDNKELFEDNYDTDYTNYNYSEGEDSDEEDSDEEDSDEEESDEEESDEEDSEEEDSDEEDSEEEDSEDEYLEGEYLEGEYLDEQENFNGNKEIVDIKKKDMIEKNKSKENISLDVEEQNIEQKKEIENTNVKKEVKDNIESEIVESLEKKDNLVNLEEVSLDIIDKSVGNNLNSITLKKPKEVYLDIYRKALDKARKAKHEALKEYLNAKNIKKQYLLDDIETSDGEDLENIE